MVQPNSRKGERGTAVINSPLPLSAPLETPNTAGATKLTWLDLSFSVLLFFASFLPRSIYLVARSSRWHFRAIRFVEALSGGIGPRRFWPRTRA